MKVMYVVLVVVLIAIAAGGGFYGGVTYASNQTNNTASDFARARAAGGAQGGTGSQAAVGPCGFPQRAGGGNFQGGNGGNGSTGGSTANGGSNANGGTGGNRTGGANGQFGNNFAQFGNCVARGQVKSVNGNTVEISTPVNVVTVQVSDQTVISKTDKGTIQDLKPGDRVTVFSKDTGDNPNASAVQIQNGVTGP